MNHLYLQEMYSMLNGANPIPFLVGVGNLVMGVACKRSVAQTTAALTGCVLLAMTQFIRFELVHDLAEDFHRNHALHYGMIRYFLAYMEFTMLYVVVMLMVGVWMARGMVANTNHRPFLGGAANCARAGYWLTAVNSCLFLIQVVYVAMFSDPDMHNLYIHRSVERTADVASVSDLMLLIELRSCILFATIGRPLTTLGFLVAYSILIFDFASMCTKMVRYLHEKTSLSR